MGEADRHPDSREDFAARHIGPSKSEVRQMLEALGLGSLEELVEKSLPDSIRSQPTLKLPESLSEEQLLAQARRLASQNKVVKSHIGMGYYDCYTPAVIQRNILENPGWYTAYTPYQAEISQGRLEALLNFQTVISELTGLPVANASLLDEGTAAAEAMTLAFHSHKKLAARRLLVSEDVFPQTLEVMRTRAAPLNVEVVTGDVGGFEPSTEVFAVFAQYPGASGKIPDLESVLLRWQPFPAMTIVATDLLSLCLLKPPGEMGADIAVGSAQRFGVPMGFGGPHAAFLSAREEFTRLMPGRLIGVSKDGAGRRALRMALQTREQHIRRERATSNICTAQVLLAVMASMYAVYHGPEGLRRIAERVHRLTAILAERLSERGVVPIHDAFFDTLRLRMERDRARRVYDAALEKNRNLARPTDRDLQISLDETTTLDDVAVLVDLVTESSVATSARELSSPAQLHVPERYRRKNGYLQQEVFGKYHSETEMLRYMWQLQAKDLSLTHSMIPLGSCTMKLNATSEMIPITWPEFAAIHPFAPSDQTQGYRQLIAQLESWLASITGFAAVSVQPNAGSQGEYAGLLVIRRYHAEKGEGGRDVCLIPSSAHGTNPASAVLAGMRVVVVGCDPEGNIDLEDLAAKASAHRANLAALMITYPSTHGVFEEAIVEICKIVHDHGGQVYMDGANLNALVGLCLPGRIGPDVCHLNLHKTFCIPHGGGGPGVGPLAVAAHLKDYLPSHGVVPACGPSRGITAVSAAPWGSAGILPISWAYIAMMGESGLRRATQVAILNANYVAHRLASRFDILYRGKNNLVAHECIVDLRPFKASAGVTADDVAKRLVDFGFHAPTMSWPVAGTLMIEPTESESLQELDFFCDAMIAIREEIEEIERGQADQEDNVLKNAPHSVDHLVGDEWQHGYPRSKASFPRPWVRHHKFWPPVGRVDNAFGDRNFVCTCPPLESYES